MKTLARRAATHAILTRHFYSPKPPVVSSRTLQREKNQSSDSDTEGEHSIGDDDTVWLDSDEESDEPRFDDRVFQRVESKVKLTSRPSLITLMVAHSRTTSQSTPVDSRSHASSSPNDSDEGPLMMMKGVRQSTTLKPIIKLPRSNAQPIAAAANYVHAQAALSPHTTRRNMLATELTESLRRHLLWERQQKSSTANAVLKRWHTSHDVADLKQYPVEHCMKQSEEVNTSSYDQYLIKVALDDYHSKGW